MSRLLKALVALRTRECQRREEGVWEEVTHEMFRD